MYMETYICAYLHMYVQQNLLWATLALSGHLPVVAIFHCQVLYFKFMLWWTCLMQYVVNSQANFMATQNCFVLDRQFSQGRVM